MTGDPALILCEMSNLASFLVNNCHDYRVKRVAQTIQSNIGLMIEIYETSERLDRVKEGKL